jgi:hypothetical protein
MLGHKKRADYDDADGSQHFDELLSTIDIIQKGNLPNNRWMAGFYYNAAIMRIDACYERFLVAMPKVPTASRSNQAGQRQDSKTNGLALQVEAYLELQSPYFERHKLETNRKEVNNLKHSLFGQLAADAKNRQADDLENAKGAVDELLKIIEYKKILAILKSQYADLPPA